MLKSLLTRAVGVTALALAFAAPLRAETLADALAYGYENSGLLEQNRALLRAADEDVAQAIASLRPVVAWQATARASDPVAPGQDTLSASLDLTASLVLYDGGRGALAVDIRREMVLGTRQSLIQVEQQILLRIVQAYMEVRRVGSFVELRDNNVRLITQQLRAAQDRFEVGEVTRTDVALAEARLAAARSLLAAEQGNLARAQAEYVAAVGRAPNGSLSPVPPVAIRQSLAEAQRYAQQNHPAIRQAQHGVTTAELSVSVAETANRPTVQLGGSVSTPLDHDFGTTSQALTLSIGGPIYQGGSLASQLRQVMAQRDGSRAQLLVAAQSVTQSVANAYASLEVARASAQASERQVGAASIAFDGVREEAELGARTTLDVLDAEQELLDARAALISAQVDTTVASYAVLAAMGLLTAEDLNLNVQIYDPESYYNLVRNAPAAASAQGQALDRVLQAIGD